MRRRRARQTPEQRLQERRNSRIKEAQKRGSKYGIRAERRHQRCAQKEAQEAARVAAKDDLVRAKPWLAQGLSVGERYRIRYRIDPEFNLRERMRRQHKRKKPGAKLCDLMRDAIRRGGQSKAVENLLGYSISDLREHLEQRFTEGMNWQEFLAGRIHIDHVVPLAAFDLFDKAQLLRAWALPNLQPMWAADNLAKGAKV